MTASFFVHTKIFRCVTPSALSTYYKCFIFIMTYRFKSLYVCWHTCVRKSSIFMWIIMQPRKFLWTKGSVRFFKKSFWKVYIFRLIFLWDSVKRNIGMFWTFYVLTIVFICYVIKLIVVGCFFRLDNFRWNLSIIFVNQVSWCLYEN